ncbi:MAG: pyridoxamine 5'-phosphate oxidase [Rhodothermales bacterium]
MDISALRREYRDANLDEEDVEAHPVDQFKIWFDEALDAESRDPSGMTLSTSDAAGRPSARIVLLKKFDRDGFVFFTNYESRKARDLEENPWAALTFWWNEIDRQVRVEGRVRRTPRAVSVEYFVGRPRDSQIGAVASAQSSRLADRDALIDRVDVVRERFADRDVPCPKNWGGYLLEPNAFEFWQGRQSRLHDRIAYRMDERGGWKIERLAP